MLLSTVFLGGMKTAEESAIIDNSKYIRLIVLLFIVVIFFWHQRRKKIKRIFADNLIYLLIFFAMCVLSALYAGSFVYPVAKSLELFAVIITTSLFVSAKLEKGSVAVSTRILIHRIAVLMLLTSLCLNLYWYNSVYVYSYTSTTVGSAAVIALLTIGRSKKISAIFLAVFLVTSLVLSYSRTSLGFAFIAIPAVFYFKNKLNLWLATPIIIATLCLSIFIFKDALIRDNSMELLLSLSGRLDHWEHAIDLIKSAPFLGYGYYYGVRIVATNSYAAREGYQLSTFDNNYLDAIVSVGFLGFIPLLIFVFAALWRGRNFLKRGLSLNVRDEFHSVACLMAVVLFCLLKALMAPTFVFFHWNQIVMFLACIALHNIGNSRKLND